MFRWLRRAGRAKSAPAPSVSLAPAAHVASDADRPYAPAVAASASDPRVRAGVYARRFAGMAADKDTFIRVLADPPAWSNAIPLAGPPARTVMSSPAPAAQPIQPALPASIVRHAEPASAPDSLSYASRVLGPRLAHGGPPWDTTLPH